MAGMQGQLCKAIAEGGGGQVVLYKGVLDGYLTAWV